MIVFVLFIVDKSTTLLIEAPDVCLKLFPNAYPPALGVNEDPPDLKGPILSESK